MRKLLEFRHGLRVLGHPLHSMLVHFPIAFLLLVFPLRLLDWLGAWEDGRRLAGLVEAMGLAAAMLAALAGLPELMALSREGEASRTGNLHMFVMLSAIALFASDLFLDWSSGMKTTWVFANLGLSLSGSLLLGWGAWLGGELVFRHGAGRKKPE